MTDIPAEERHANGRKIRKEALPEDHDYKDLGCELAPSCLSCPFPQCRHDLPGGARELVLRQRDEALRARWKEGANADTLATEFGVSRRTVIRVTKSRRQRR